MSLKQKIQEDLKQGMLSKDSVKVSALRLLLASITTREKEVRHQMIKEGKLNLDDNFSFSDDQIIDTIFSEVKKRRDSIQEYNKANRNDLSSKEQEEIDVLQVYLPKQLSEEELRAIVAEEIEKNNITEIKQMGLAMKKVLERVKGQAESSLISMIIKEMIGK
ncbi:MAG TPA: GatB/YqeY domain-containing protein [Candidatus Pacearchaeota archaeon]|nr:GatB/YqeY domain-containing protein [Candidatus Parcubacteria bacterium]HNZ83879.1 GatB/YqeY domain-containing protein [Candidatus Pacearchaeota archaeon]HPM08424.1 GatB/YqeY domain-containing protein [Candidatus Pacearchaeota archaeon]